MKGGVGSKACAFFNPPVSAHLDHTLVFDLMALLEILTLCIVTG